MLCPFPVSKALAKFSRKVLGDSMKSMRLTVIARRKSTVLEEAEHLKVPGRWAREASGGGGGGGGQEGDLQGQKRPNKEGNERYRNMKMRILGNLPPCLSDCDTGPAMLLSLEVFMSLIIKKNVLVLGFLGGSVG